MRDKLTVKAINAAAPGTYQDGAGLMLDRTRTGGKWIWRYSFAGKRRDMGLGSLPDVGLADARKARDRWQAVLQSGLDPVTERARMLAEERAKLDAHSPTLADALAIVFAARKAKLRGEGERGRWLSPLEMHVLPVIGARKIASLTQHDIHAALAPIWRKMPPTAEKAIQRIGIVFRSARLMGVACDPFAVDAARAMLGEVHHVTTHIAATPWQEIPALYARLGKGLETHRCLRFMILTCVRSDAARGARYSEVDGDLWTVPADRIKGTVAGAKAFRVPLSDAAMGIVAAHREYHDDDRLFPGHRGNSITATGIESAMNGLGEVGRPHGFRTSFRTWAQDHGVAYDVAETILGHAVGGKVERSYARSDLLDHRRAVMADWAQFVTSNPPA